ncbi:MAG: hypothetical protein ABR567_06645 [Myxococcales bacterium]|nr:hypothetical protein [Myxococcales bacterium]
MPNEDKGLNRGGTMGQQAELDEGRPDPRDREKQKGGIDREPNLEEGKDKKKVQPTHVVD